MQYNTSSISKLLITYAHLVLTCTFMLLAIGSLAPQKVLQHLNKKKLMLYITPTTFVYMQIA